MLDPAVAAILAEEAALGPPGSIEEARARYADAAPRLGGPPEPVAEVRDEEVAGVPVRHYRPEDALATVVWLHGGGWIMGSVDTHDAVCRALAVRAGAEVVSVDYRLAPEHPFPAALEDAERVLLATEGPVAVAGDSAGGNLAAVLARRHRDRVAFQLLVYPATDAAMATASYAQYGGGEFGLSRASMALAWASYAPHPTGRLPDASPLRAASLAGLPPALVLLAECDPLTDDGLDYAERLRGAGVPAEVRVFPQVTHGFLRWRATVTAAHEALDAGAAAVRAALRG